MIKKKLNILLLLSLVLLFTSLLGTTSFARILTEEEIENFILNTYIHNNSIEPSEEYINQVRALDFSSWVTASQTYEGRWYISCSSTNSNVDFGYYTGTVNNLNLYGPYINSNTIIVNTSYLTRQRSRYTASNGTISNFSSNATGLLATDRFFYTDSNIYNQSTLNGATILYNAGYMTDENIFSYNFTPPDYFEIDINNDFVNNTATLSNDTSGTEYYLIPYSNSSIRIGNMFDLDNLAGVVKRKFRYKESIRDFELISEYQADINNLAYFGQDNNTLIVYEYFQADTTEFITFIPKADTDFSEFTIALYFVTNNTAISGGVINTADTFSGDYYNNYNNDTNTDKIIENTNDDSNVENIIDENLSGDVNSFSSKLGYSPLENPFLAVIRFVLEGICNTLLGTGDQVLEFEFQGETITINSQDFTTPSSILTTFMSGVLVTFYLFAFYKYGFHIYEQLQSGEFTSVIKSFSSDNNNDYKEM